MFIITEITGTLSAFNTDYIPRLALSNDGTTISNYNSSINLLREENAKARFEDIVNALASNKVPIYDSRKKVGYWKRSGSTGASTKKAPDQEAPAK